MIKVDDQQLDWQPGLTLARLMAGLDERQHIAVVRINGKLVSLPNFAVTPVPDQAVVELIPLVAGG